MYTIKGNHKSILAAVLLILSICTLSGCGLVPGTPVQLIDLEAKPVKNLYQMLTRFDPEKDLEVIALYDSGENFVIPRSAWTASTEPDTAVTGEQTGSVHFGGKTAVYSIFVYTEGMSPETGGNGNGPVLEIPLP